MFRRQCDSLPAVIKTALIGISGYLIINVFVGVTTRSPRIPTIYPNNEEDNGDYSEKVPPQYTNPNNLFSPGPVNLSDLEFKEWLNRETWNQDDPDLVAAVKQKYLIPPSTRPYNLSLSMAIKTNPSDGQVQAVESLLRKLSPGFFIECGANDGELNSNTIWLEKELGWTGLLAEADPYTFRKLLARNRKAWSVNVCLSGSNYPKTVTFYRNPIASEAGGLIYDPYFGAVIPVGAQSIPLFTLLLALNRTAVDFFSLDVEGNELQILQTIPFDRVQFKVLTIEHLFITEGKKALWRFMKNKGYVLYKTVKTKYTGDSIFVHPSLLNKE